MTDDEREKDDRTDVPDVADRNVAGEPEDELTILETDDGLSDLVDPPILRDIQRQQERMRDLVDPPFMRSIRKQQELMRNLVDPPGLRAIREQQDRFRDLVDPPALRSMREQQERMRDLFDPPALRAIREQQERLRNLVDPPVLRALRDRELGFRDLIATSNLGAFATTSVFARSVAFLGRGAGVIESAFRMGHLDDYASTVGVAALGLSKLAASVGQTEFQSVEELLSSGVAFLEQPLEDAPAGLLAHVPPELFRAIDLDESLRGVIESAADGERNELATRTVDELEVALGDREPELVSLLRGARQALVSNNADKTRHVCISLRELLGHALRRLAPDDDVIAWSRDPAHYHQGRPTRRARLEYLYSSVPDGALRSLIAADIRAAIELFDVLSEGSHVANMAASPAALMLLMTRAEGVLLFLVRIASAPGGAG